MNPSSPSRINRPLHWFAVLTAIATFLLLGLGGLVTSHEAGMSVPDWPTSYGYNMFALPIKFWTGGAFFEHTHRLLASGIGLMTTILMVWLWVADPRKWMRWLGVIAFFGVIAQGILGGLRVRWHMDYLGVPHGVIAQSFLILICAIALFTGGLWRRVTEQNRLNVSPGLRRFVLFVTIVIFAQLVLGATMRHQHAGLAISDFPLAHGKIWPDTSVDAIARYNAERMETVNVAPITAFQVVLQMIHRLVAGLVFLGVAMTVGWAVKRLGKQDLLVKLAWFWLALIILQVGLGAWTIWSNKAADVATAHVLIGALSLVTGALWCIIAYRRSGRTAVTKTETAASLGGLGTFAANR